MNYSLQLKEELIQGAPHAACCRRAYLRGLFLDAGETRDKGVVLKIAAAATRHECARMYRELYRREALVDGSTMLFSSDRLYRDLTAAPPVFSCPHCIGHFLRGAMISCGSVTDPEKGYHLEFNLTDAENLALLTDTLRAADEGWMAKCRTRSGNVGVYFKNSTVIEEILTFLGANNALFTLMNAKIARGIRNDENRATNCVATNIGKAVDAAAKCCAAIERIRAASRFDSLSAELQETARLRLAFPEATLAELAQQHNPPITKSGLNHRLQRIMTFAESLK